MASPQRDTHFSGRRKSGESASGGVICASYCNYHLPGSTLKSHPTTGAIVSSPNLGERVQPWPVSTPQSITALVSASTGPLPVANQLRGLCAAGKAAWLLCSRQIMAWPLPRRQSVPHPVPWTHICAMPPGTAHTPRAPRSACDTQASRDARSGCTAPRSRPRRRGRPRGSERFGRGSLAP